MKEFPKPAWFIFATRDGEDSKVVMKKFSEKSELNDWLANNGTKYSYMQILTGYTLEERRFANASDN